MTSDTLSKADRKLIDRLVLKYDKAHANLTIFLKGIVECLTNSALLMEEVHSIRWRMKGESSLRQKLERKILEAKREGAKQPVTDDGFFYQVNDLIGIRILYLHTQQFPKIDRILRAALSEQKYDLHEKPFARVWDEEFKKFYLSCGIKVEKSQNLYSSVHYVIRSNSKTMLTCEIQVRTLMEEVWGEVDHAVNYPKQSDSESCREQIKALARFTTGCVRLVDSIFLTHSQMR